MIKDDRLHRWGVYGTISYLLAVGGYSWWRGGFFALTLCEFGDFLSGVCAPIAAYWLILGFFQQGHEIRLNTQELRDMKIQTERQAKLLEEDLAIKKAMHERDLQPIFVYDTSRASQVSNRPGAAGEIKLSLPIKNLGGLAQNIIVISLDSVDVKMVATTLGRDATDFLKFRGAVATNGVVSFEIACCDVNGAPIKQKYSLVVSSLKLTCDSRG